MRQVTRRYASNLLGKGTNNDFTLVAMTRRNSVIDNMTVGYYYYITIVANGPRTTQEAAGATPLQAVERCLVKHGVTFR